MNQSKDLHFLLISNETQCVSLPFLSTFIAFASSLVLDKSFLEETSLNLGLLLKYLVILILFKG